MVACLLQPWSEKPLSIDQLLGRNLPSRNEENRALEELTGTAPLIEGNDYDTVMQKIAARRAEEARVSQ